MGRGSNSPGPARLARSDLKSPSPGLRDLLVLLPGAPAHAYGSHHPTAVPDQRHAAREDPDAPPVGDVDAVELPPGLGRCGQVLGGDIEGAGGEGLVDGDVDGADPRPVHARVRDEVPPRVDHRYVHGLADLLSLALGGGDHPPCVLEGYTVCHRLSSFPPAPPRRTLKLPTNNHDATTPTPVRTSENYPSETVWKIGSGPEWGPRRPPGGHEGESIGRLLAAKIYALEASGYFPNSFSTHFGEYVSFYSCVRTLRRSFGLGFPLQDFAVCQVYAAPDDLHRSLLPEVLHGLCYRLPVGADHGAQLLVGVGGVYPYPLSTDDALARAQPEYEARQARRYLLVGQLREVHLRLA